MNANEVICKFMDLDPNSKTIIPDSIENPTFPGDSDYEERLEKEIDRIKRFEKDISELECLKPLNGKYHVFGRDWDKDIIVKSIRFLKVNKNQNIMTENKIKDRIRMFNNFH